MLFPIKRFLNMYTSILAYVKSKIYTVFNLLFNSAFFSAHRLSINLTEVCY